MTVNISAASSGVSPREIKSLFQSNSPSVAITHSVFSRRIPLVLHPQPQQPDIMKYQWN